MEIITIDGMVEHDFRHSIEDMLRLDQVDEAVERLRALLEPCTGFGRVLPPRFLDVTSADVEFAGWHRLADRLCDHDRPNHPISAIGVTLADARALGGPGPSRGRLQPFVKTFYFNDDAYPFSDATRDDLLDGYSRDGFEWQGDYQATDATLSIKGIDDLYGAIVELEDRLFDTVGPDEEEIRAGTIGACYLAALMHQSLRDTIRKKGLPRPLCILAACDGIYPFFDAPVAGSDECMTQEAAEAAPGEARSEESTDHSPSDNEELSEELSGVASLLTLVSRKGAKAPVIALDEDGAREAVEYSEMAAQQLITDHEHAPARVLEGAFVADLAEAAAPADGAAWGETEPSDHFPDPPEPSAIAEFPFGPASPIDMPGDGQDADSRELPNEHDRDAARIDHPWDVREAVPDELEGPVSSPAEWFDEPPAAPASHSLRARINLAKPDPPVTTVGRIKDLLGWIRRMIFGA
ncbi:MAG: hypothetical protein Q8R44_08195 [Novosphingobium sp.]|nr:hypothetical protein [Novosphingobium sp.]